MIFSDVFIKFHLVLKNNLPKSLETEKISRA